jgi:hypothetical protein
MRIEIEGAKKGKVMKLESFFDFPEEKMFSNKKKIHALLLKFFLKNYQNNDKHYGSPIIIKDFIDYQQEDSSKFHYT